MSNALLAVQAFKEAKPKKTVFGPYRIEGDQLLYRAQSSDAVKLGYSAEEFSKAKAELKIKMKQLDGKLMNYGRSVDFASLTKENKPYGMRLCYYETDTVAKRIERDGKIILLGNGSILPLIGRRVSYGNVSMNKDVAEVQNLMRSNGYIMIPFSVFETAKLDLSTFETVEQAKEETLTVREPNPQYSRWNKNSKAKEFILRQRHFVGASLFKVGGKCFLFDVDRREIKHKIFNPFLVQIPKQVKTIEQAYETLKPKAVIEAEAKGLKVLRQGEWFFIPTSAPTIQELTIEQRLSVLLANSRFSGDRDLMKRVANIDEKTEKQVNKILEIVPRRLKLTVGNNRPNTVEIGLTQDGKTYVTGKISHDGREHADLKLKAWFIAIPNTSSGHSFTITGDVD